MKSTDYERYRFFLKDTIRKEINFANTPQHQNRPAPPLQKSCPKNLPRIDLPDGVAAVNTLGKKSIGECLLQRRSIRKYSKESFSIDDLAMLLYATQGVCNVMSQNSALRMTPSAGTRHSFETYIVVNRVESLQKGIYRYLPFDHQLVQLRLDDNIEYQAANACLGQQFVANAAVTFFWTTIPERMEWRYDLAAHKVIALDAGHVCQNLYLACQSISAGTCAIAAYDQEACDTLLGVDGKDEFTLYIAPVGKI